MRNINVKKMVGIAILMALIVILQLLGQFIKFGPVSISLVLVPIVVGAAFYGPVAGAILGATFSVVVLSQPDTAFFYSISVFGTIITVLVKGTLAGYICGLIYNLLSKYNTILAVAISAAICPIINTGIFFLGCRLFFWEGLAATGIENVAVYIVTFMIGINFIAEFVVNILCCPIIVRLLNAINKK